MAPKKRKKSRPKLSSSVKPRVLDLSSVMETGDAGFKSGEMLVMLRISGNNDIHLPSEKKALKAR